MWLLNGWWSHGQVWLYNAIIKTDTLRKAKRKKYDKALKFINQPMLG